MVRTKQTATKASLRRGINIGTERRPMNITSSSDSSDSSEDEYFARARAWSRHEGPGENSQAREGGTAKPWLHGPECYHGCIHTCGGIKGQKPIPDITGKPTCPDGCNHHYDCIEREMLTDREERKYKVPVDPYLDIQRQIHEFYQSKNSNDTQEALGPEPMNIPQEEEKDEEMVEEMEEEEEEEEEMEEENEMGEDEMLVQEQPAEPQEAGIGEEEDVGMEVLGNDNVEPPAPMQEGPNNENHGFAQEGLLPDPFAPEDEDEDPQSDVTDVDDLEPQYVIGKEMFDELLRYLHGGGGPGAAADD